MAGASSEILRYPIVRHDYLTIAPEYMELQRTRGTARVQLDYGEPAWVVTRYHDVRTVYGDRRFVKELGKGHDTPRMIPNYHGDDPSLLAHMDPPRHTRIRRLASGAFSPGQMRKLSGWVDGLADDCFDDLEKAGPGADVIEHVSWNLPLRVITGILGIPEPEVPMFRGWIDQIMSSDRTQEEKAAAYVSIMDYNRQLLAARRATPHDDLLGLMVQARDHDDQLTEDELLKLAFSLYLAGFETTAAQIGSTAFTLLAQRDLYEELQSDPDLLPAAIEELWRWIPSFRHGWPMLQWASEDVELSDGTVIPAGEAVVPEHQIANRDETVFPDGGRIDFHRVQPEPHLSLAWGPHRCMGAFLAQLEIQHTVRGLLRRFPTLELAVPAEEVPWSKATFLRSPASLPVTW
jgi:cytochrome P450 RapN